MTRSANIFRNGRAIGGIYFDAEKFIGGLNRNKTAIEFTLMPPLTLLWLSEDKSVRPCFWNVSGRIYGKADGSTDQIFLGHLSCRDFFSAPMEESHCEIYWHTSVAELLEYEEFRNGKTPVFKIDLRAQISIQKKVVIDEREEYVQTDSSPHIQTIETRVPLEIWHNHVRNLGLRRYCLVELRMDSMDDGLKEINASIQQAISYFYTGGSIGWRDTVGAIRVALEKLDRKFPNIFRTPANKAQTDLDKWTKLERIYNLIWSVKHLTHIPHHNDEETWNRDEALLVLNNLIIISHLIQKYNTKP